MIRQNVKLFLSVLEFFGFYRDYFDNLLFRCELRDLAAVGMMGPWIGIALIEVGGASACGGLEAEGQESFALCLSPSFLRINSVKLKRGAPELKVMCFPFLILNIPSFQHSINPSLRSFFF